MVRCGPRGGRGSHRHDWRGSLSAAYCEAHDGVQALLYCGDCRVGMCRSCFEAAAMPWKVCPACETKRRAAAPAADAPAARPSRFCTSCGASQQAAGRCARCHAEPLDLGTPGMLLLRCRCGQLAPAARYYCGTCGRRLERGPEERHDAAAATVPARAAPVAATPSLEGQGVGVLAALAGAALLFMGCFIPVVSAPLVGGLSYQTVAGTSAMPVMVAAGVALVSGFARSSAGLWLAGGGAAAVIGWDVLRYVVTMAQARAAASQVSNNLFAGLAGMALQTITLQWGVLFLVAGAGLVIFAAIALAPD